MKGEVQSYDVGGTRILLVEDNDMNQQVATELLESAGAKVTITNVGTKQKFTVVTSDSGSFTVNSLDPVTYEVLAEFPSFKKALIPNVKVDTATSATVNMEGAIGFLRVQGQ